MASLPYLAATGSDRGSLHPATPASVPEVKSNGKRRTHVKSRSGCRRCKTRRVKCDEKQPACGACNKRGELCVYEDKTAFSPVSASPSALPLQTTRTRELALFHHWTAITCESLSSQENRRDMRVTVPQLALSHDYLLNAIFAITAAHLAYLNPEEAQEHFLLALQFHSVSLSSFRPTLATISPAESPALVHCSVLLGLITLALRSVDSSLRAISPIDTLCQLANMWRGTASIRDVAGLSSEKVKLERTSETPSTSEFQSPAVGPLPQREAFFDRLLEAAVDHPDEAAAQHYTEALRSLKPNIHWTELGSSAGALRWIPCIPADTIVMMQRRDPLAVAITLFFCSLLKGSDEFWWIGSFASDLLEELSQIIPAEHPSLEPELQWVTEIWSGD